MLTCAHCRQPKESVEPVRLGPHAEQNTNLCPSCVGYWYRNNPLAPEDREEHIKRKERVLA